MNIDRTKIKTIDEETRSLIVDKLYELGYTLKVRCKESEYLSIRADKTVHPLSSEALFNSSDFTEIHLSDLGLQQSESSVKAITEKEVKDQLILDAHDVCSSMRDFLFKVLESGEGGEADQEMYEKACNFVNNYKILT